LSDDSVNGMAAFIKARGNNYMNSLENFSLKGKVALVTGAGRGLGAKIAETLAGAGASVMITDIDGASAQACAEELAGQGSSVASMQHDVTDEARWVEVVAKTIDQFGGYDVLVNNAGIEDIRLFEDTSLEAFQNTLDINVNGTFLGIKHSIRAMKPGAVAGNGGSIVNLSSVAGMIGFTGLGAYCAAKGAVRLMTKAAANECGDLDYGIRVNSIHPGVILTEMGSNLLQGYVRLELTDNMETSEELFEARHPLGLGNPENVANLALFLASPASGWTTGAEHIVDGGLIA
jgi:NAD(P)-dependent dehydrogenase (short-subunit alcohol dehydrogenase family)